MKQKEALALTISIVIGIVIIFGLQPFLLADPAALAMVTQDVDGITYWEDIVMQPLLVGIFVSSVLFLLVWFGIAVTRNFMRSRDAFGTRVIWFGLAIGLFIIYELLFLAFGFTGLLAEGTAPIQLHLLILPTFFVDLLILFWLPTALATPRALRYVPPLSMKVRSLIGG